LAQWLSPAFPVGGYTFSQGLEWAIAQGTVNSADSLRAWLADLLEHGSGRSDAILLALALRDEMSPEELADLAAALAPGRERRMETEAQGAAFAAAQSALGADVPPLAYPLAVGVAARRLGLPAAQVAALWLQAYAGNLVQIAVRLVPLGQGEGQAVLAALHPLILRIAAEAAGAGPEALGSGAFLADLAAMHHETQEVRLCRT
jgi:urease accessory protein